MPYVVATLSIPEYVLHVPRLMSCAVSDCVRGQVFDNYLPDILSSTLSVFTGYLYSIHVTFARVLCIYRS